MTNNVFDDFPMLVYIINVCTEEGYVPLMAKEYPQINMGTYQPEWLRIRTKVIENYTSRNT